MFSFFLIVWMYDTILRVAHDIVLIGWALLMILGVILLLILIGISVRINRMVSKGMHAVSLVSEYIMLPFSYIAALFASRKSEQEEETPPAKKRTTARRK